MSTWNMPPGVTTNDIPGNEPDPVIERYSDKKKRGRTACAGLDDAALNAAAAKLRKLRLTDVGGDKEHPCETVKSALKRVLGGLYDDEAVTYILRHGLKYYQAALSANAE